MFDLTDDLTPNQFQQLLNWLWINQFQVTRAAVIRWRRDNGLPILGVGVNTMKKKSKKTKREPRCKKCYLYSCHFCGSVLDNRGWAIVWANKKNGPEHHMCFSCAE